MLQEQTTIIQKGQKKAGKNTSKTNSNSSSIDKGFAMRLGAMELLLLQARAILQIEFIFMDCSVHDDCHILDVARYLKFPST